MILLRTIEYEFDDPKSVVHDISYHIIQSSRLGTFLNWSWKMDKWMIGHIYPDETAFILNPVIKQWIGHRPSMVKVKGTVKGSHSLLVKLVLSPGGTWSTIFSILILPLMYILPLGSVALLFQMLASFAVFSNFYSAYRDVTRTEKQLDELLDLIEKG